VQPGEVFAAGLALMIISYNNFSQRTLKQKLGFCCAALQETSGRISEGGDRGQALRRQIRPEMSGLKNRTNYITC